MLSEKVPFIRSAAQASARKNGAAYVRMQGSPQLLPESNIDSALALDLIPPPGTRERQFHPLARELARILRNYRRRKRLSIEELAEQSGIAVRSIKRFERASHAPDVSELLRLAAVYGIPAWKIVKRLQAISAHLHRIDNEP